MCSDVCNLSEIDLHSRTCQYFNKLRESVINAQQTDKQPTMIQCFESLMEGIDRTLLTKNRDRCVQ